MSGPPLSEEEKKRSRSQDPAYNPFGGHWEGGFWFPTEPGGGVRKPENWTPFDPIPGHGTPTED
jgi:hypothetical protein